MQFILDAVHGADGVFAVAEGGQTEIAFAAWAEAGARSTDDVDLGEQFVEELPGGHVVRGLEPDVRCIDTTIGRDAGSLQSFTDDASIFHIVGDGLFDLLLAFRCIDGSGTALDDVRRTIEFRGMTAIPELVELDERSIGGLAFYGLRDDGVAAAGSREAGCLGEGTEFDGYVLGALNLIDGAGNILFGDIGSIGSVEQDDGLVLTGIVDPFRQLSA